MPFVINDNSAAAPGTRKSDAAASLFLYPERRRHQRALRISGCCLCKLALIPSREWRSSSFPAAERGRRGECYILSNRFVTIPELMACIGAATGRKVPHCYPLWLVKRMAPLFEWIGKVTHTRPLFTRYSLYTLGSNGRFSHDKATTELGYCPMDIKDSVRDTILYLRGEAADNLLPG